MKFKTLYAIPLVASALTAPVMAVNSADEEAITAIQANALSWAYAYNTGNVSELNELYTEDAIIMPPNDTTVVLKGAIENYWQESLNGEMSEFFVHPVEIKVEGNTAYQASVWSARDTKSGAMIGGNTVTVLERQTDGRWKTKLQSWN